MAQSFGGLAAQLWVAQSRQKALDWATAWAADPPTYRGFLIFFLGSLRGAFFERYASGDAFHLEISDRAQQAAMMILEACSNVALRSHEAVVIGLVQEDERVAAIAIYRAAEQIIGELMNQLYFGSGAYTDSKHEPVGVTSIDAMRRFLDDYSPMLRLLAGSHEPHTHHYLIELQKYLIPVTHRAFSMRCIHFCLVLAAARGTTTRASPAPLSFGWHTLPCGSSLDFRGRPSAVESGGDLEAVLRCRLARRAEAPLRTPRFASLSRPIVGSAVQPAAR